MTNEEKAIKIVERYETKYNDTRDLLWTDLEDVALEMAKWKDEQELKFLQELCVHSNLGIVFEKMQNRIKELKLWK